MIFFKLEVRSNCGSFSPSPRGAPSDHVTQYSLYWLFPLTDFDHLPPSYPRKLPFFLSTFFVFLSDSLVHHFITHLPFLIHSTSTNSSCGGPRRIVTRVQPTIACLRSAFRFVPRVQPVFKAFNSPITRYHPFSVSLHTLLRPLGTSTIIMSSSEDDVPLSKTKARGINGGMWSMRPKQSKLTTI